MSSQPADTRTRILESTLSLLEASQGKGVRMSDIAKSASISRQAVYLHFSTRTELLVATTIYLDDVKGIEERLRPSRTATSGVQRLHAFIDAWGSYIPEIYGVAKALLAMKDSDDDAAEAWGARMQDVREGCAAAVEMLAADHCLNEWYSVDEAVDVLWSLLSIRFWEQLTQECGWSQPQYLERLTNIASDTLIREVARVPRSAEAPPKTNTRKAQEPKSAGTKKRRNQKVQEPKSAGTKKRRNQKAQEPKSAGTKKRRNQK